MRLICFSFINILIAGTLMGQAPDQSTEPLTNSGKLTGSSIFGKLIDKNNNKPIPAASVQLYTPGVIRDTLFDGMLTKPNGEFNFNRLPATDSLLLIISAPGYQTYEQKFVFSKSNLEHNYSKDMGNILLQTDFKQLSEVVVNSNRPALQMGIDRKVFDVSKSLLATGGTAIDIMKNIPSVSVDIDGNVQLRNSAPQIFIDGRPTILTLDQIPADHIDKIELITNPSAKFDAASAGGIINIVLKKNKRVGLNGLITISGGTPGLFSSNLNLNLRQGKFNFFMSAGTNLSKGLARGQTLRQNKKAGVITDYFNQYSTNDRNRDLTSLRVGTDIFISNRNTFTISQDIAIGNFSTIEKQNQEYFDNNRILQYTGIRTAPGGEKFRRQSTSANFKHSFPKEGKEFTVDARYSNGSRSGNSNITTLYFNPNGTQYQQPSNVWNDGEGKERQYTFQADYVNPINDKIKIETGIRSFYNDFVSYYNAFADDNGQTIKLPLSNNYLYDEMINAAYFTYSAKQKSSSYQIGLRSEYSKFTGELPDSAYKFGYEYPAKLRSIWDGLFPSLFVTKKLSEKDELQFNYSRRIRRPRFWQLNPFVDINDPANLRQGNPELRPEFVNSLELNYSKTYLQGSILAVLYFRNNPNDITEYSDTITDAQYLQFANAAINTNAILNTFINASTTNNYGAEFTLQHRVGKNFDITPTVNLQYRTVNAKINSLDLSNDGFNWEAKLITNYMIIKKKPSFFNNIGFQMILDYESPQVIPQGRNIAEFLVDMAIKKEFLKNKKGALTFAVSDVFNSRRWGTIYDTEQFYQDSYRRMNVRNFRLSFSYKFGDSNFSLFSNSRGSSDDD